MEDHRLRLVAREIERALGVPPARLTMLPTSGESIVCSATVDGRAVIFKAHEWSRSLHVEAWVAQRLASTTIPVAGVLAFDPSPGSFPAAYLITDRLPGVSLPEGLFVASEPAVMRQVGRFIREVHEIRLAGAGWISIEDGAALGANDDWAHSLEGDLVWWLSYAMKHALLDDDVIDHIWSWFRSEAEQLRNANAGTLLHSDFRPEHVLVEGATVSGIIDFQGRVGDPVADLIKFSLWSGPDSMAPLLEGYEPTTEVLDGIAERGGFYRMLALGLVQRWFHERDTARAHLLPAITERILAEVRAL